MSDIELHRKLLGDRLRNEALQAALAQAIVPGSSTVADLGAGTGLLSFLARQLGARHCWLVEYSDALVLAQKLARQNGIRGLSFLQAHSAEVAEPPQADIVISETLGNYALEENLLETLVDARRFLRPGGVLIPSRLRQYVAPVVTPRLQQKIDIWPDIGFDLNFEPARVVSLNNMYVQAVSPQDLAEHPQAAQRWDDIAFAPSGPAPRSQRSGNVRWVWDRPQTVYGYALWWKCELVPGVELSTSPHAPATHWEQVYLPLLAPHILSAADVLELTLTSDTRPEAGIRVGWTSRQRRGGETVLALRQDTKRGLI